MRSNSPIEMSMKRRQSARFAASPCWSFTSSCLQASFQAPSSSFAFAAERT